MDVSKMSTAEIDTLTTHIRKAWHRTMHRPANPDELGECMVAVLEDLRDGPDEVDIPRTVWNGVQRVSVRVLLGGNINQRYVDALDRKADAPFDEAVHCNEGGVAHGEYAHMMYHNDAPPTIASNVWPHIELHIDKSMWHDELLRQGRTDDVRILQMREEGVAQEKIADTLHVSQQAVAKRLSKLRREWKERRGA